MIAAIYARKSQEQRGVNEEDKSVARQIEHARAYALESGWTLDENSIFVDDGIGGAEFGEARPGLARLLNAVDDARKNRRAGFQILIVSDLDRIGREQLETGYLLKQLAIAGVRVFTYLEKREIALNSPTATFLMQAQAFAGTLEREKARQRTHDALIRKARAGYVAGGRVFGYDNADVLSGQVDASGRPKRAHVERRINEAEAAVVRQIFRLCADGLGKARIAHRLNDEGATSPRAQRGRPRGWASSSVNEVLYRELYRGVAVWNRTRKRNTWGQVKPQERAEGEWERIPVPQLRIVSEELWAAAHERLTATRRFYLRSTKGRLWGRPGGDGTNPIDSKHLLTGLTACGKCNGGLEVNTRRHGQGRAFFYMCSTHHRRGAAICRGMAIRRERADTIVLDAIEAAVLNPAVLRRACELALDGAGAEDAPAADGRRAQLLLRGQELEREIQNLANALAKGDDSRALRTAIGEREAELAQLTRECQRLMERRPTLTADTAARTLEGLLPEWRDTLRQHAPLARQLLRKLLNGQRVVITPETRDEQPGYRVRGKVSADPLLSVVLNGVHVGQVGTSPTGPRDLSATPPGATFVLDAWYPRAA